jgi:glycosyltransferase involved in cell wall biosynthesis
LPVPEVPDNKRAIIVNYIIKQDIWMKETGRQVDESIEEGRPLDRRDAKLLRICLVASSVLSVPPPQYGALETQVMLHACGLAKRGHEVHVVTVGSDGRSPRYKSLKGVHIHAVLNANGSPKTPRNMIARELRFGKCARNLCEKLLPDVVHYHSQYSCYIGLASKNDTKTWRTVYHAHNWKLEEKKVQRLFGLRWFASLVGAAVQRRILAKCDYVVANSEFVRTKIAEKSWVREAIIGVVPLAVDTEVFVPDRAETRRGKEVIFVGRIAREKGLVPLIQAMRIVIGRVPDAHLTVIGPFKGGSERGAYAEGCMNLVRKLGLQRNVTFAGEVSNRDLPKYFRRARVQAVPSLWETAGLVVLEGMAAGIPVVASEAGGIQEIVEEGRTGIMVPPGDANALAKGIVECFCNDDLTRSAAIHGPEHVRGSHGVESVVDRLEAIYRQVACCQA